MSVIIGGYSERGMITALCADILKSPNPLDCVREVLACFRFPFVADGEFPTCSEIESAQIFIEQSFSTFGTPDVVFLLSCAGNQRHALFVEAKIGARKKIGKRWRAYLNEKQAGKPRPSRLFTQLERQQRLLDHLKNVAADDAGPLNLGRELGRNAVVREAACRVIPFAANGWVAALIPDSPTEASAFYEQNLCESKRRSVAPQEPWSMRKWGYATWSDLDSLARGRPEWSQTAAAFDWNDHQIYGPRCWPDSGK